MNENEIETRLAEMLTEGDFRASAEELTQELVDSGATIGSVDPILRFMEENPAVDFGTPGPLVHFVERFYRHGYETELLASLDRKPTAHTVWMLNRLINGAKKCSEHTDLLKALQATFEHPRADVAAKRTSARFLGRLKE